MPLLQTRHSQKYTLLLIVLVFRFLTSPFLEKTIGFIVSSFIMLLAIISIIRIFCLQKYLFFIYASVASLAFFTEMIASFNLIYNLNIPLILFTLIIYSLYLGIAIWLIMKEVFLASQVTLDAIFGGISIYLLIGFVWSFFYGILEIFSPDAFSQSFLLEQSYAKTIYFSFTTLTTLGYGDIVPVQDFALVLTNMEAIIGQMYPAIFIATLVGSYLSQRPSK